MIFHVSWAPNWICDVERRFQCLGGNPQLWNLMQTKSKKKTPFNCKPKFHRYCQKLLLRRRLIFSADISETREKMLTANALWQLEKSEMHIENRCDFLMYLLIWSGSWLAIKQATTQYSVSRCCAVACMRCILKFQNRPFFIGCSFMHNRQKRPDLRSLALPSQVHGW